MPTKPSAEHECPQCRAAIASGIAPPFLRGDDLHAAIVRVMAPRPVLRWRSAQSPEQPAIRFAT